MNQPSTPHNLPAGALAAHVARNQGLNPSFQIQQTQPPCRYSPLAQDQDKRQFRRMVSYKQMKKEGNTRTRAAMNPSPSFFDPAYGIDRDMEKSPVFGISKANAAGFSEFLKDNDVFGGTEMRAPPTNCQGLEEHQRVFPTFENLSDSEKESQDSIENLLQRKEFNRFKRDRMNYDTLASRLSLNQFMLNNSGCASLLFKIRRRQDLSFDRLSDFNPSSSKRLSRPEVRRSSQVDKRVQIEVISSTDDFFMTIHPNKEQLKQPFLRKHGMMSSGSVLGPVTAPPSEVHKVPLNSQLKMQLSFEKYIIQELQKHKRMLQIQQQREQQQQRQPTRPYAELKMETQLSISSDEDSDSTISIALSQFPDHHNHFNPVSPSLTSEDQQEEIDKALDFCFQASQKKQEKQLSLFEQEMLDAKVFKPYFLTNSTIVEYQHKQYRDGSGSNTGQGKLSLFEILEHNFLKNQASSATVTRLYFQISDDDEDLVDENSSRQRNSNALTNKSQRDDSWQREGGPANQNQQSNQHAQHPSMYSQQDSGRFRLDIDSQRDLFKAPNLEVPLHELEKSLSKQHESKRSFVQWTPNQKEKEREDEIHLPKKNRVVRETQFFEFEIRRVEEIPFVGGAKQVTLLTVKDVTSLIKHQQKLSDRVYQSAIENNYSHETMTPLNCIMGNSSLVKQRLLYLFAESQEGNAFSFENFQGTQLFGQTNPYEEMVVSSFYEAKEVVQLMRSVEQSSKSMWYFTMCQLQRMKLKQNKLKVALKSSADVLKPILKVLWPFEHQIEKRKINVTIFKKDKFQGSIITDWKLYELILFNIIQNAVKYNKQNDGDIAIILSCEAIEKVSYAAQQQNTPNSRSIFGSKTHMFKTEVIDTGTGVSKKDQGKLFKPFQDIKTRGLNIGNTQNQNTGLGLTCSKDFLEKLNGTIKLKQSEKGLSVFKFAIPVTLAENEVQMQTDKHEKSISVSQEDISSSSSYSEDVSNQSQDGAYRFIARERPFPHELQIYFMYNQVNIRSSNEKNRKTIIGRREDKSASNFRFSRTITAQPYDYTKILSRKNSRELGKQSVTLNRDNSHPMSQRSQNNTKEERSLLEHTFKNDAKSYSYNHQNNYFSDSEEERYSEESSSPKLPLTGEIGKESSFPPPAVTNATPVHQNHRILSQNLDEFLLSNNLIPEEEWFKEQSPINEHKEQSNTMLDFSSRVEEIKAKPKPDESSGKDMTSPSWFNLKKPVLKFNPKRQRNSYQNLDLIQHEKSNLLKETKVDYDKTLRERAIKIRHSGSEKHILGNFGTGGVVQTGSSRQDRPVGFYVEEIDKSLEMLHSSYCDRSYSNLLKSNMSKGYSEIQDTEENKVIENRGRRQTMKKGATQFQSFNRLMDEEDDTSIDKSHDLSDSFSSKSIGLTSEEEKEEKPRQESKNRINLSISNLNSKEESKQGKQQTSDFISISGSDPTEVQKKISNQSHQQVKKESNGLSQMKKFLQQNNNQSQRLTLDKRISVKKPEARNTRNLEDDDFSGGLTPQFDYPKTNSKDKSSRLKSSKESASSGSFLTLPNHNHSQFRKMKSCIGKSGKKDSSSSGDKSPLSKVQSLNFIPSSVGSFKRHYKPSSKDSNPISQSYDSRHGGSNESKSAFYDQFRFGACELEEASQSNCSEEEGDKPFGLRSCNTKMRIQNELRHSFTKLHGKDGADNEKGSYCCKPRILVVDDTDFNLLMVTTLIKKNFDIVPEEAVNGQIAVDMYKAGLEKPCQCPNRAYRLILMDIQMPVMDGFLASEKILEMMRSQAAATKAKSSMCITKVLDGSHKQSSNRDLLKQPMMTSIVALTAYTSDESIKKCVKIGMKKVLPKPVSAKQINEVMQLYYYRVSREEYKKQLSRTKRKYRSSIKQSSKSSQNQFKGGSTTSMKLALPVIQHSFRIGKQEEVSPGDKDSNDD